MKKILAASVCILLLASGCSPVGKADVGQYDSSKESAEEGISAPVFTEESISSAVPKYVKYKKTVEAENGKLGKGVEIKKKVKGYSGKGYVSGISSAGGLKITFSASVPQFYDITLRVMSDGEKTNIINVGGKDLSFVTEGSGKFENVYIENLYIDSKDFTVEIKAEDGGINVDRVTAQASDDVQSLSYSFKNEPQLINKNASDGAKKLYETILENYGKRVLSGQYASIGSNAELDLIYSVTGKYPALRMGDMMPYTSDGVDADDIGKSISWASDEKGIVSYIWHWAAPDGKNAFYSNDTDFKLSDAVTKEDIALLSQDELETLVSQGKISESCLELVKDIDAVSAELKRLAEKDIAVLWRPLHDASRQSMGFWWGGSGFESYNWLWKLLYRRQTEYHHLNNLIWVWSAQSADWYVGDNFCDMISADIYDGGNESSQINAFLTLKGISSNKPIALSECANAPGVDNLVRDRAYWSWFGIWSGNYIMNEDGTLCETYTSEGQLIKLYNNNVVMTLDDIAK